MHNGLGYKIKILHYLPRYLQRRILFSRYQSEIESDGEFELRVLHELLDLDDVAIDVGVNLGVYSYALSLNCAQVIGFEPNPTLAAIVRNLRLPRYTMINAAASSYVGTDELMIPKSRSGHVLASLHPRLKSEGQINKITVKTVSIDSLELERLDFIKIDVEGFEEEVLAGAKNTLINHKPIILCEIEERHNKGGLLRISELLKKIGYDGFYFKKGVLKNLKDFSLQEDQNYADSHSISGRSRAEISYINNFIFLHRNGKNNRIKARLG